MFVPCGLHRVKRSCFNCGGDHELSACNQRRNMQRIDENRRQFQQRKLSAAVSQTKQTRCSVLLFDYPIWLYISVYDTICGHPPGKARKASQFDSEREKSCI